MGHDVNEGTRQPHTKARFLMCSERIIKLFQSGAVDTIIAAGQAPYQLGPVIFMNFQNPDDRQHAYIKSVQYKELDAISPRELKAAGLKSRRDLLDKLSKIRPEDGGIKGVPVIPRMPITVCNFTCG